MDYQLYASGGSSTGEGGCSSGEGGSSSGEGSSSRGQGSSSRGQGSGLEPTDLPMYILQKEEDLDILQETIKRVQDGPPSLTTIYTYTFYNTEQLLNTAEVSPDSRLLAAGFDNSCIKLWSPCSKKLKSEPPQVDASHIHLAHDVPEEDENHSAALEMKVLRGHWAGVRHQVPSGQLSAALLL